MLDETVKALGRLRKHHLAELRASGLSDDTIVSCGFYSEDNHAIILSILNRRQLKKSVGTALVIPFRDASGELNGFKRLKLDNPRKDRNGQPIKYESPAGQPNQAYIPPGTFPLLDNPESELLLTEGEKKAAKADQDGFPCIGLVGVFGWKAKRSERLLPELEAIAWQGRKVRIVFDSDLAGKPEVADAESRLAAQLRNHGAVVRVVRLPDGPDGEKVGLDDFLLQSGPTALRKLIDKAEEPEPVDVGVAKVSARELDSMPEARRFIDQVASKDGELRLRHYLGDFWGHDGRQYRELTPDEIRARVIGFIDPVCTHITRSVVSNIMQCVAARTQLASSIEPPCWLKDRKGQSGFIALQNGILDVAALLRGEMDVLLPHSPLWFSRVCLPFDFDAEADCPKWLTALDTSLEGDCERISVLQEFFGLCLEPDTSLQRFLMLIGEGNNGKSVVCAALRAMLGPENVSHVPLEMFGQRFQLTLTVGKLANIASEIGEIDKVAEGHLKAFTSGDAMHFDRKGKEPISAVPTARLVLASNNRPRFTDRSGGLWRRMIIMPFNVSIPEEKRVIGMDHSEWWQEQGELPGMLSWALAGLHRIRQQNGFSDSASCSEERQEYRAESNPARLFLQEFYVEAESCSTSTPEAYRRYRSWCEENGYRPLASNSFGKEIKRVFPLARPGKVKDDSGKRRNGYFGIGINPDNPDSPDTVGFYHWPIQ